MRTIISILIFSFIIKPAEKLIAQGTQDVFPGLMGQELIDSLSHNYRPATVLDYANSRDTLYAKILSLDDDSIHCIYSGHAVYLDRTQDPTQYIYQNGGSNGMNTEHAYPQGKGATSGTNAHSDMHHLFPTRIAVNEARGEKPFGDIPDVQTQKWFYRNQVLSNIPPDHIDWYAESGSTYFEPREESKGDIARAIFYFYTVYRGQANQADPNFFDLQRSTLCQWTEMDLVDSAELRKTWLIASYQDGKPNPFVIDCTLAYRSWCPEMTPSCIASSKTPFVNNLGLSLSPQPAGDHLNVRMNLPFSGKLQIRVLSLVGSEIKRLEVDDVSSGQFILPLNTDWFNGNRSWTGLMEVNLYSRGGRARQTVPVILVR